MPRFLADECCDSAVVRSLRRAGYDVTAVSEVAPGSDDSFVMGLASRDGRVVLTEDKDFGRFLLAQKGQRPEFCSFGSRPRGETRCRRTS